MATEAPHADVPSTEGARLTAWWRAVGRALEGGGLSARWWELTAYGSLILVAGVMRLWDLGSRAMHHDESLHSFYSWKLYIGDGFTHTPMMHGPLQFEANAGVFFLLGDSDVSARLLYAVVGTALVGLPFLFRQRLGRLGALFVAGMLTFSPAMLYFSRFARNDIIMAFWALSLVIAMWRFIDSGRHRYLYISSGLLALAFATKETVFILVAILGMFLAIVVVPRNWSAVARRVDAVGMSPAQALGHLASELWRAGRALDLSRVSRPAGLLILMITLTLPQWSAVVSIAQDSALLSWTNLVLAQGEGSPHIGAPAGGGLVLATLVVMLSLSAAVYAGARWNWAIWWRSALIFYGIWVVLYTTFFTNLSGVGSGLWQSLGYWVVQQGEARGGQPAYYYFVIGSIYEFLPLVLGVVAAVYYVRRRDVFGRFLVFWAVATMALYTVASEKMPWLLVNITLPMIVLSGKFLGDIVQTIRWRRMLPSGAALVIPGVPVFGYLLWQLAFFEARGGAYDLLMPIGLAAGSLGLAAGAFLLGKRVGASTVAAVAVVPVAVGLLILTVRTGAVAAYVNSDLPVEMIVYTQTSPDIKRLRDTLVLAADATGQPDGIPITIDQTSGFTWPWAWYLRDQQGVDYPSYATAPLEQAPDTPVLVLHSNNQDDTDGLLIARYAKGERIPHRQWFPEETYRGLTLGRFLKSFGDRQAWRGAMDYFLYRKGVRDRIGSEDAYVYFSPSLPQDFQPAR